MIRQMMFAAAAALALSACGQGGTGAELPKTQEGAQAPTELNAQTARQDNLTAEERAQLETLVASYLANVQQQVGGGLNPAQGFSDEVTGMQPGTDHRWQVNLNSGTAYRIIGACDNECSNMDIELIDVRTGGVVASDTLPDDYPVVNFTPPANGQYIVRMMMITCTIAPCYAGARVLS
jgi:hypothetical protein